MKTLTPEEFAKMYGQEALANFGQPTQKEPGYGGQVVDAFKQGVGTIGEGINEANPLNPNANLIKGVGKILGGTAGAVSAPIAPPMNATLGRGINYVGDKISNYKGVQDFAMSPTGERTASVAEDVANYAAGAGLVAGGVAVPKVGAAVGGTVSRLPRPKFNMGKNPTTGTGRLVRDMVGEQQDYVNHHIAQALELAPSDIANFKAKTGLEFGEWLSDNNLIGRNRGETTTLVRNFKDKNYEGVRQEIAKVTTEYTPNKVPRLTDALKAIQLQVKDVVGMEEVAAQVDNMLHQKTYKLADVQKTKELLDEHFSLYKVTGEVKDAVAKEGLANVRRDIQKFIEDEVKNAKGKDVGVMNKNVMAAWSIDDAIEARTPKTLTGSLWKRGDTALAFFGIVNPIVGIPLFFLKKAYETPTVRLRIARYLDQLSDRKKAQLQAKMEKGELPPEIVEAANSGPNATAPTQ